MLPESHRYVCCAGKPSCFHLACRPPSKASKINPCISYPSPSNQCTYLCISDCICLWDDLCLRDGHFILALTRSHLTQIICHVRLKGLGVRRRTTTLSWYIVMMVVMGKEKNGHRHERDKGHQSCYLPTAPCNVSYLLLLCTERINLS